MQTRAGISGFERNAMSALFEAGRIVACPESRARRVRGIGIRDGGWPSSSIDAISGEAQTAWPAAWRTAEPEIHAAFGGTLLDHHATHARTAFGASGFERAGILVCDSQHVSPESLWLATPSGLVPQPLPQHHRPGIAARLAEACTRVGLQAGEFRELEALARQSNGQAAEDVLRECLDDVLRLAAVVRDLEPGIPLCVAGGLFLNGYVNLQLRRAGLFDEIYVPPDPSNAGLAIGCAMPDTYRAERLSAFLGPSFADEQVKSVLDNCKLTYRYVTEEEQIDLCVRRLRAGRLIGWFRGAMEWGPRALGHRSILASPFSPYVSHNLNQFLKHRPGRHTYALAVLDADAPRLFVDPVPSPYMEAEAEIVPGDRTLGNVAGTSRRIRIQTVGSSEGAFAQVLSAFRSEAAALVNTSFNGFHEPIVATPRDAVRVFYGTGLDALAIGSFWLEK